MLFCNVIKDHSDIQEISQNAYKEEMAKTRKIIDLMLNKLDGLDTNIDVI